MLLQRGAEAELIDVILPRALKAEGVPEQTPGYLMSGLSAATAGVASVGSALNPTAVVSSLTGLVRGAPKEKAPAAAALSGDVGIGIGFTLNDDGFFVVTKLVAGGAAASSGLVSIGDLILACDGEDVSALSTKQLVQRIKGPPGTSVTLGVVRSGSEPFDVEVVRAAAAGAAPAPADAGASTAASVLGIFSKVGTTATQAFSATAGGASAAVSSSFTSLTSLMGALPSLPGSSKGAAGAAKGASAGEPVGVGLGIKKNVHGDFMVTQVAEGGVAAASGKVCNGDILQAVDGRQVAGLKSAALRELILGAPGSTVTLAFSRWTPGEGGAGGAWSASTVTLTRSASRLSRTADKAPARPAAGSAVRPCPPSNAPLPRHSRPCRAFRPTRPSPPARPALSAPREIRRARERRLNVSA